ncbi:hypothetical protein [Gymnodinialimonas hymeniacidonis]|uniref:hypothetical protein n=1 Tax=Gymnodinialimonas hymeniacidonis TaxID=3126508 RepID=UPI0034C63188
MTTALSFFRHRQKLLLLLGSAYVAALIVTHAALPPVHVWAIACVFSVLMNFVYIVEARAQGRMIATETIVMVMLITASLLGLLIHPLFVIAAIFAHGLWDLAKHYGHGVPFFSWYTWGCCAVDLIYGTALLLYWLSA